MKGIIYPLDLSALAYPMMRTRRSESNYRFTAELTCEVDPRALTESLSDVLSRYPVFKTRVAPSFFWHVLRENDLPLIVKTDDAPPLHPLRKEDTNGYPFRLAYTGKEIVLEVFHAVTDANISSLFFSDLLTRYAEILRADKQSEVPDRDLIPEDAFLKWGEKKRLRDISLKSYNGEKVCALEKRGTYRDCPELLSLEIALDDLRADAKSYGLTITEYLTALYISAIAEGESLPLKEPICIFIPVDLRRFFPSRTMQNFVCFERILLPKGETDISVGRVAALVHDQFASKITEENMRSHVNDVRRALTLPVVKYTPLFLKQPIFKFVKCLMNKVRQTAILSNIGKISLPERAKEIIKNVRFYLNIGKNAPINLAVVTYNGVCRLDVTNGMEGRDLPDRFFSLVRSHGKK